MHFLIFSWYFLLLGIVILLASYIAYRIVHDNYQFLKSQNFLSGRLISTFLSTFFLWFPMLVPIVFCFYYDYKIEKNISNYVYSADGFIIQKNIEKRDFVQDLDTSLILIFEEVELRINQEFSKVKSLTESSKNEIPSRTASVIRSSYSAQQPDLMHVPRNKTGSWSRYKKRKKAKFYNWISETVTNQTNKAIKGSLDKLAGNIEKELEKALNSADNSSDSMIAKAEKLISQKIDRVRIKTYQIVVNFYYTINIIKTFIDTLFLFAILKSFLYVFARVLFKKQSGVTFSLLPNRRRKKGALTKFNRRYRIPGQSKETFYVKRNIALNGPPPRLAFPQFTSCFLSRLINGAVGLDKIDMKDFNVMATFSQPGGKEFIEYDLLKGEKCVFKFKNFVGMSSSIKLCTEFNFQLPSFLLEHLMFTVAEGPGKLILKSNGHSIVTPDNGSRRSASLKRIIAFQKNTEFSVSSNLEMLDVFFSDFHLEKQNTSNIIIDSEFENPKRTGIIRFFLRFLLPV